MEAEIKLRGLKRVGKHLPFAEKLARIQRKRRERWIGFSPDPAASDGQPTRGKEEDMRRLTTSPILGRVSFSGWRWW